MNEEHEIDKSIIAFIQKLKPFELKKERELVTVYLFVLKNLKMTDKYIKMSRTKIEPSKNVWAGHKNGLVSVKKYIEKIEPLCKLIKQNN